MATGDIEVYSADADDAAAIDTALTGKSIVVADTVVTHVRGNKVYFTVIKA